MATLLDSPQTHRANGREGSSLPSLLDSTKSCLIATEIDEMGQKGHTAGQRVLVQEESKKGDVPPQPIVMAEKMPISAGEVSSPSPGEESSSWGIFGKALQPLSWMKRQFQTVAKAVEYYRNSDLSFGRVVEMFSG